MTQRARLDHDAQGLATNRTRLLKRALFLFVVGLCYTPLWPADILHFYGAADADVAALFGTKPMPLYLLAGAGTAIVVIAGSIALTERFATARWIQPIVSTGRLALTLYVAHVVIGMGTLETLGVLENQSPPFAIGSALLFCMLSVGFAHLWKQRFQLGPLEWVMRRLTG